MTVVVSESPTRVIVRGDQVSVVTVGIQGPAGIDGAAGGGIGLSAGTSAITTGTAIFSNSNNVSFGMSNGTVTASASYPAQTQFVFSNSNGLSFGTNGSTVTGSYTVPTQTVQTQSIVQGISAGTQVGRTGDIVFSNSNGISFGMAGSNTVTASYTVPTVTNSSFTVSDNGTSGTVGRLAFTNLNGVTLSLSTGAGGSHTIVGSHNALTSQSNQAFSAAGGSSAFQTLSFNNANGATFSNVGGAVQLSYTVPTQSAQTVGIYGSSQTTGQSSSSTVDARSLSFRGAGNISVGLSGGEVIIAATGGAGGGGIAAAAGTQTATSGTINFANSNGATFGMSNSSQITLSYTVPSTAGLISAVNVSAGTTSNNLTAVTFSNSNNVSFGLNGSVVTATVTTPAQTAQTLGLYASSNTTGASSSTTVDARTLSVRGAGIVSVGYSGGELVISGVAAGAGDGGNFLAAGTQTAVSNGSVKFADSNGISFGMSNSSQITASYTVPSTAGLLSAINVSAGTTSNNSSAFVFSNSNNFSFGLNGGTITGSYTVPTVTNSSFTVSDNGTSGTVGRLAFTNLNGVTLSLSTGAGGSHTIVGSHNALTSQSNQAFSAAGGSSAFQTLSFNNANGATFSNVAGAVQLSYTVPSTAGLVSAINLSAGTTSNNASAFTLSNSNNVSFGLNGSTITASASFAAQTVQTIGIYGSSQTTGQSSSSTFDARSLSFRGAGNVSVGMSGGEIIISATGAGGGADGGVGISAGANSQSNGTVVFSNSNGISFGLNASTVTASYTVPSTAGLLSAINLSAGTTSNNLSAITFSNSNGLSFGLNGSVVTGSYTVPVQSVQTLGAYAISNTIGVSSSSTFDARSLSFQGAGVASVGMSAGAIVINVPSGGGGGGGNSVAVTLDFGASFTDKAQTIVTGQTWVGAASEIVPSVLVPAGVDPDEIRLLDFKVYISDLVAGDGFTVTLYSETEAKGTYTVMCIGV